MNRIKIKSRRKRLSCTKNIVWRISKSLAKDIDEARFLELYEGAKDTPPTPPIQPTREETTLLAPAGDASTQPALPAATEKAETVVAEVEKDEDLGDDTDFEALFGGDDAENKEEA